MTAIPTRWGWLHKRENRESLMRYSCDVTYLLRGRFSAPDEVDPRPWMQIESQRNMGSCFPAGTLVRLDSGSYVPIEQVLLLDSVTTAEGRTSRVTKLMARAYEGEMCQLVLWGHKELHATPEHPIFTKRGYVAIKDLVRGDWVAFPRRLGGGHSVIQTAEFVPRRYLIMPERTWQSGSVRGRQNVSIRAKQLPDLIVLTPGLGRILGLFLAEGCTTRSKITWTFNENERDTLAAELVGLLQSELGLESTVQIRGASHTCKVNVHGTNWAAFFEAMCAHGAAGKRIHSQLMVGPPEFLKSLLEGWIDGDGHRHRRGHTVTMTVSRVLAHQMFDIACGLGMRPSIRSQKCKATHGVKARRPRWEVAIPACQNDSYRSTQDDSHLWRRVVEVRVTPFSGYVYNLSVEGDESYVANGIGVHNCQGHALSTCLEYAFWVATSGEIVQLSRFWAYIKSQILDGIRGDRGSTLEAGRQVAMNIGLPLEASCPYPDRYSQNLPSGLDAEAAQYKIRKYQVCRSYADVFDWIAAGLGGVEIGIMWGEDLMEVRSTIEHYNAGRGGGHAVSLVGYTNRKATDGRKYLILANSWGTEWGNGGFVEVSPRAIDAMLAHQWTVMIGLTDMASPKPRKVPKPRRKW